VGGGSLVGLACYAATALSGRSNPESSFRTLFTRVDPGSV